VSIIPEFERQLRDAAERRTHSPFARLRGRLLARPLVVAMAVVVSGTGAAFAAKGLAGIGAAAPRDYPSFGEKILPAGTRLLSLRVPDPAGGPPWGMRLIFTTADRQDPARNHKTARWGCVQIGRVVDGRLGILGQDGAFHNDGLFHELPVQPEACGGLNHAGQLIGLTGGASITASAYRGLEGCLTGSARHQEQMALPSIERQLGVARAERDLHAIRAALEGLATYRKIAPKLNADANCLESDLRHVVYGVAGPDARSVTVTGEGHHQTISLTPQDDGAYLIVQPVSHMEQMHSALRVENLALQVQALHRTVHYENGRSCPEESTPSCLAPLGSIRYGRAPHTTAGGTHATPEPAAPTALSRRAEHNPASPNPVTVTPRTGRPHAAFKLTFRALLNGGGYSYQVEAEGGTACQRVAERAAGGDGVAIGGTPIVRGQTVTKTFNPPRGGLCRGRYRIYVAYDNPESQLQNFPFATVRFVVNG
jgi:hypothetical protein